MLDQFSLDRQPYEPNPEPMEPIPLLEGLARTLVSAEGSAKGAGARAEVVLATAAEGGIRRDHPLGDVFSVTNSRLNRMPGFAVMPFAQGRFAELPLLAGPANVPADV